MQYSDWLKLIGRLREVDYDEGITLALSRVGIFDLLVLVGGGGGEIFARTVSPKLLDICQWKFRSMKFSIDGMMEWWYAKTQYTLHFCIHGKILWRHYDIIGLIWSSSKMFCCQHYYVLLMYISYYINKWWLCINGDGVTLYNKNGDV